jgi:1-acyl-sn-glycerol-3-phosphate acyltransferase
MFENFKNQELKQEEKTTLKKLEKGGEKDWTYEKIQKAIRFAVEKLWGDKFRVSGTENIPNEGSALIAVNHSSHIDPEFLMAAIDRPIHFIGLQDKEFNPLYVKIFYKLAGVIGVSRNPLREGGRDFVKKLKEVIKNGELVGIFPEGILEEKEDKSEIAEFKSGVFSIAKKYGLQVVPVYLSGTDKVRPHSQPKLLQKIAIEPVEVKIGKAMNPQEIEDVEDIRRAIVELSREGEEKESN